MRKILPRRRIHRDAPPKIVYLIGFLAYVAWGSWTYLLFNFSPENPLNRVLFLGALAAAVFLTSLFLLYQSGRILTGRAPRVIFYPAARRAVLLTGYILLLAGMQLLEIFTWVNAGLLGLILLLTEIQLSRR